MTKVRSLALAGLPIVVVVLATGVAIAHVDAAQRSEDAATAHLRIDLEVERTLRLLVDAETASRGYLLTHEDSYLGPLDDASATIPSALDKLVTRVADDDVQRRRAADLSRLAGRRLAIAEDVVRDPAGDDRELIATLDSGRSTMDELRVIADDMSGHAAKQAADELHGADDHRRAATAALVVAALAAVVGLLAYQLVTSRARRRAVVRLGQIEAAAITLVAGGRPGALPEGDDEIGRLAASLRRAADELAVRSGSEQSERRFREYLTAAAAPAVTIIEVVGTGEIAHVSSNTPRVLGWDVDAMTARGLVPAIHVDDLARFEATMSALTLGESSSVVVRVVRADGEARWMEVIILLAGSDEQQILVYFLSDVDQLQRARDDAEVLRSTAEQANTAKNDFLSRMSHELRTPLNAILGFTQLLELDELQPDQEEAVAQILRAGRHLLGLINEVLDISRIETGRLAVSSEPVPVAEVFDQAWELVAIAASERGITIRIDPPIDRTVHVRADQQRLKQVFVNLLSNAVKYSVRDTQILVGRELRDDRMRIVIRDAGPGIAPDKVDRLFQPFERLGLDTEAGAAEGVGLGLALSKALVEAMNGSIGVDSEPGAGSRFWVELEVVGAPDAAVPAPESPVVATADLGTILYIEDNSSNLRLVERILEHRPGLRLVGALTGGEGLEKANELRPQIVLLDLDLPDMRGERVLDALRGEAWGREIPVVVLSADATPGLPRQLAQLGASAHMTKPVDVRRLLDLIDGLMAAPV